MNYSSSMDVDRVRSIRQQLKYAWVPFFAKFGTLTPIQVQTIPRVLAGKNVVVVSPTASGKTEAVVAPIAERLRELNWQGLSVLYIVPTRALANDTLARIRDPLDDMGIKTAIKHGDRPYLAVSKMPNFVITTPESLDSMICRHPEILNMLRAVILDEVHLLDNTYRGDQLRILLRRLKTLVSSDTFSIYLLSATFSSPYQIAKRYVNDFEVVAVPGQREVRYYLLHSLDEVYQLARSNAWKKLLCFCNLRESVERLAAELRKLWHSYPVVVHHGSLSRQEREKSEMLMKEEQVAVCVATSTLEIGIDIGDIDLIVLAEPPWSVSSLLQRIGRGNRRRGAIYAAALVKSDEEELLLDEMFKVARSGTLPVEPYIPDPSVTVQQVLSYLYQNREGVSEKAIKELLSPLSSEDEVTQILTHLRKEKWLEWDNGLWVASPRLMDAAEKGQIHSNIPDSRTYTVIDIDSGKEIGNITGVFDEVFVLAGRAWAVVSSENGVIYVRRFAGKALAPFFRRCKSTGAFYHLLPGELKAKYRSTLTCDP